MKTTFKTLLFIQVTIALLLSHVSQSQNENVNLLNVIPPFADGERTLSFKLETIDASTVYVFYSNDRNTLNNVTLNNNGNNMSYGKAILFEKKAGPIIDCKFTFPNKSSIWPNADLYRIRQEMNASGLLDYDFLSNIDRRALRLISTQRFNNSISTDMNPKNYRKECVFYRVLVKNEVSKTQRLSVIKEFYMPDDFTIGLAGDSYAAGTGVSATTTSDKCYRTQKSGQVLGVKLFMKNNPDISVDYKHVACSGAETEHLFAVNQIELDGIGNLGIGRLNEDIQFNMLKKWMEEKNHNQLNMLLMNIGGNNVGFGAIVIKYFISPLNFATSEDMRIYVPEALEDLKISYDVLDDAINNEFPLTLTSITNLPNPFRNKFGRLCGSGRGIEFIREYDCADTNSFVDPPIEFAIAESNLFKPINNIISQKVSEHKWGLIDVADNSIRNGICVCENEEGYFWTFRRAMLSGDMSKTIHPNEKGYDKIYKNSIARHISDRYFNYFQPLYPLQVLLNNIETPQCDAFYKQWASKYKTYIKIDAPKLKLRNFNLINNATKHKMPRNKNAKQAFLSLKKIYKISSKPRIKYIAKKNIYKRKLDKEIRTMQNSPLFKKLLSSKTDKEWKDNYYRLQKNILIKSKKLIPVQQIKRKN